MLKTTTFGTMPDGQKVEAITLVNSNGMQVTLLTLGATIQKWCLADANHTDIVLGFDSLEDYLNDTAYLGRTVGRYANRIAKGRFKLEGQPYQVSVNLQGNALHGGSQGFHNRVWRVIDTQQSPSPAVTLQLISEDGDQGFPGTLTVTVQVSLDDTDTLNIEYRASSDKDTVFNPTQHSYFNLAGHDSGEVLNQHLQVLASHYTPADESGIPSGEIRAVHGNAFDLTQLRPIGEINQQDDPQLRQTQGLDHNFCLDGFDESQTQSRLVAVAMEPVSGRKLLTRTSMPGAQIYTGNFLGATPVGKKGVRYGAYHGFCIESQFYPDSPNQPTFPSTMLRKGEHFHSLTSYQVVE